MPELIDDGITGFFVDTIDAAVEAVGTADLLDRDLIRATALDRFDVARMIDHDVATYASILGPRAGSIA